MKKTLLLSALVLSFFFRPVILEAQSDKSIIKTAQALMAGKACDSAFFHVLTVKKVKKSKVQAVINKAYPCLTSKNVREANAFKLDDREDDHIKCDKLGKMIYIMKKSRRADSLLNLNVKPDVYKKLSRKKSIDRSLDTYEKKLEAAKANIIKLEKQKRIDDSLAEVESIRQAGIADSLRKAEEARLAHINDSLMSAEAGKTEPKKAASIKDKYIAGDREGTKRYYIIAGAFKTEEEALIGVEKLKAQGFANSEPVNINPWGNLRICFNSYDTYAAALEDIDGIRSKYRWDAWILTW